MVLCEGQARIPTGHAAISTLATKKNQKKNPEAAVITCAKSPNTTPPPHTHKHKAHSPPPLTQGLLQHAAMWLCTL